MRARMLVLSCKAETFVAENGKAYEYSTLEVAPVESDGLGHVVQVSGVKDLAFKAYGEYAVDFAFVKRDKGFRVRVTALHPVGILNHIDPAISEDDYMREIEEAAFKAGMESNGTKKGKAVVGAEVGGTV